MKNFRKVLALVLVVATLFSFTAMAGAKTLADYTDADKITTENYEVAVEVLSALEILNGYEDDTFKPTNTITRAEMAKMIAVLANAGDDNVDKLYAAACNFADVDKVNDWFASYVSYCAYTGIVAGRSADVFDPYGKVTGLETAKMLLVTMGFSAEEQGYVGANWKINVLRDAQNFGLLEGFAAGYDVDAAITREEAANMMLNALKAPVVVGVLSDNIVKITNALYQGFGIEATLIDAEKYDWISMYGNVIVDGDTTLGEALYDGRLDIVETADCYGRPGSMWTLKNGKGTVVLEGKFIADPIVASDYTGEIDLNDVLEEEYDLANYKVDAFVDGEQIIDWNGAYDSDADAEDIDDFAELYIGKGVLVEVYVDDVDNQITIVVVNTYIGVVTAVLKASDRFVIGDNAYCFSNTDYGFEQDDVILFWLCTDGETLHDAQVIEPATAAITRAEKNNVDVLESTFTAGGKVYEYAWNWAFDWLVDDNEVGLSKNEDWTWDIYTDLYGYAMYLTRHVEEDDLYYAYVVENSGKANRLEQLGDGTFEYTAEKTFVDFDAKITEGTSVDDALWFNTLRAANDDGIGNLIEYTIDEDGRAVATAYAPFHGDPKGDGTWTALTADGDLVYTEGTAGKVTRIAAYGNDDTKYLIRTWNYETEEYEYSAYTQDTLPSGYAGFVNYQNGPKLFPVKSIQYFTDTVGEVPSEQAVVATYVFADVQYALSANRALVLDHYKSVTDAKFINKIGACDYYEAVVNGAAGYVILTQPESWIDGEVENAPILIETALEIVGLMDNGLPIYALASYVDVNVEEPVEFVGGELIYNGASVDMEDDFFAVVVDPDGDAHVFTDAAKLNDYVETLEAWVHANECDEVNADGECECTVYSWLKGWMINEDGDSKVDELYVVLDLECFADDCADNAEAGQV